MIEGKYRINRNGWIKTFNLDGNFWQLNNRNSKLLVCCATWWMKHSVCWVNLTIILLYKRVAMAKEMQIIVLVLWKPSFI